NSRGYAERFMMAKRLRRDLALQLALPYPSSPENKNWWESYVASNTNAPETKEGEPFFQYYYRRHQEGIYTGRAEPGWDWSLAGLQGHFNSGHYLGYEIWYFLEDLL